MLEIYYLLIGLSICKNSQLLESSWDEPKFDLVSEEREPLESSVVVDEGGG